VFRFPIFVSRAVRVLLACIALAMAMPAGTAAAREDLSACVATVSGAFAAAARVANVPAHGYPTTYVERELVRLEACPSATRLRARAFLLHCSLLC
jgi:uncharacterized membrane protein YoaK (UPF0700 family)